MAKFLNYLLLIYQRVFSPYFGENCRFYPSCSEYVRGTLDRYSFGKAIFLSFKRILKCHPYHRGGIDLP